LVPFSGVPHIDLIKKSGGIKDNRSNMKLNKRSNTVHILQPNLVSRKIKMQIVEVEIVVFDVDFCLSQSAKYHKNTLCLLLAELSCQFD
jgi:hypothetical protein